MNRLRQALGDSADRPHYIETLARRSYRWMVAVDRVDSAPPAASDAMSGQGVMGNLIGRKGSHFRAHFREILPGVPIVASLRRQDNDVTAADYNLPADNPPLWVKTVRKARAGVG